MSGRRNRFLEVVTAAVARRGVAIMGVCNVTPDSFSDGGLYLDRDRAIARAEALLREGADVIDVGGESTRPGAKPVPADVQIARVLEVVRWASSRACVSIDTTNAAVAAACLDAGADVVNDVSCLADEELARVAAAHGAALVLSHARAPQEQMRGYGGWPASAYDDVVKEVLADWERAASRAAALGLPREALVMDWGLGFSKASRHSFELLRRADELVRALDVPVLFGASRKSFLTLVDPRGRETPPNERLGASIAAALHAARAGVQILRVHDVRDTRQALDMDVVLGTRVGHGVSGRLRGVHPEPAGELMLEGFRHLFSARPWHQVVVDVLDILIVTYVVYRALLVLRGTRAVQMGTGLGIVFLIYVVSKYAGFVTLFNLLSTLLSSIILIVVVVFQNDIRRGLMRVGSRAFLSGFARQQETRVIDEVVAAATELARHRMGALICFEQDANLDEFVVAQGTTLDASVQRELLVSLFIPESLNKLHDGAVVIRNLRIAKGGVFFPMPDTKVVDKSLGSRHRAALGITEETDAVVVVVSEERGTISFCFNGNIVPNLDGQSLKQALIGLFGQRARANAKKKQKSGRLSTGGPFRITLPPGATPPSSSGAAPSGSFQIRTPLPLAGAFDASPPARQTPPPPEDSVPARITTNPQETRPMQPAKPIATPIETPIPMPQSTPPGEGNK